MYIIYFKFQRDIYDVTTELSSATSSDALPPPCPHCGARKGSHFGWVGGYGNKIYLCNVCGKEHTYGDMLKYNKDMLTGQKIIVSLILVIVISIFIYKFG